MPAAITATAMRGELSELESAGESRAADTFALEAVALDFPIRLNIP